MVIPMQSFLEQTILKNREKYYLRSRCQEIKENESADIQMNQYQSATRCSILKDYLVGSKVQGFVKHGQ
jgi:hypothetical protein